MDEGVAEQSANRKSDEEIEYLAQLLLAYHYCENTGQGNKTDKDNADKGIYPEHGLKIIKRRGGGPLLCFRAELLMASSGSFSLPQKPRPDCPCHQWAGKGLF